MEAKDLTGLKIENEIQFDKIYHLFRSAKSMDLDVWLIKHKYPEFPIYLEKLGDSYGYCTEPRETWSEQEMQIIQFSEIEKL